jgi:predicted RNase H-like nuclease
MALYSIGDQSGGDTFMRLAGIDLAWKSDTNTTAVAIGDLEGRNLRVNRIEPAIPSLDRLEAMVREEVGLVGVAIDAPLIINNESGQRECERSLSAHYSRQKISCHSTNLLRYPNARSVKLSSYLYESRFEHLQSISEGKFQIECYPHPAIIEIFGLPERLKYKKGKVSDKKHGQMELAVYILALKKSRIASPSIDKKLQKFVSAKYIESLAGAALKTNEDVLDSIICLYVGALFAMSEPHQVYGCQESGYIYVPTQICAPKVET